MKPNLSSEEKARLYDEMQRKAAANSSYRDIYLRAQADKRKSNNTVYVIFLGIVGILIITAIISSSNSNHKPNESSSSNKFLAYTYAERFVKRQLKAPSTAKFPGTFEKNDHITQVSLNEYKIVSWVDSQNSFGAMIRTNFSCIIKFDGDQVTCNELQLY